MEFRLYVHNRSKGKITSTTADKNTFVRKWKGSRRENNYCMSCVRRYFTYSLPAFVSFSIVVPIDKSFRQRNGCDTMVLFDTLHWCCLTVATLFCTVDTQYGAITCMRGRTDGKNTLIHFNSLINNYANTVERALSVFCHFDIDRAYVHEVKLWCVGGLCWRERERERWREKVEHKKQTVGIFIVNHVADTCTRWTVTFYALMQWWNVPWIRRYICAPQQKSIA